MRAALLTAGLVLAVCGTGAAQEPRSVIERLEQECTGTRECLAVLRDAAIHQQRIIQWQGGRLRQLEEALLELCISIAVLYLDMRDPEAFGRWSDDRQSTCQRLIAGKGFPDPD